MTQPEDTASISKACWMQQHKGGIIVNFTGVPVGFGMALAQNEEAMNAFAMMTKEEKQAIWKKAYAARSAQDMQRIVSSIIK